MSNLTDKDIRRWEMARYTCIFLSIVGMLIVLSLLVGCSDQTHPYRVQVTATIEKEYKFSTRKEAEDFVRNKISNDYVKQTGWVDSLSVTNVIIVDLKEEKQ